MQVSTFQLGKRYNREVIFKNFSFEFLPGAKYAITGANGSGKSTLLKVLSAYELASAGEVKYQIAEKEILAEEIFPHLSYASPYLELPEELSFRELLNFQKKFKSFKFNMSTEEVIEKSGLVHASDKWIKLYSSGMKQRVKLCLALLSDTKLKFLDEPTTNLDSNGQRWYLDLVQEYATDDLLIVASNDEREFTFCDTIISIHEFKK